HARRGGRAGPEHRHGHPRRSRGGPCRSGSFPRRWTRGRPDGRPRCRLGVGSHEGVRGLIAVLALTFRNLRAHRRRLIGTGLAVVLGVAFLTATLVMGDTMRQSFRGFFTELTATTDVEVRSTTAMKFQGMRERGPVPTDLVDELEDVEGVAAAEPDLQGSVQI